MEKYLKNLASRPQSVGISLLAGCLNALQLLTKPRSFLELGGVNRIVLALFFSLLLLQHGQRV